MAAHAYQRTVFVEHGFSLWNNLWYSGRYTFVTYSLVYYPLAALVGIGPLAVAAIALAALAFSALVCGEWGLEARWSSRTFALVWAAGVLSAAFPFMLGVAFGLVALWALRSGERWQFAGLVVLTVAASPVAFLLLGVVVAGLGLARRRGRSDVVPAAAVAAAAALEIVLWRLFESGGRYPFSPVELLAACAFCVLGTILTWRVESARSIRLIFSVYLVVCLAAFLLPSALGENVCRLRFVALPLAVLASSLRRWRPVWLVAPVVVLACSWNVTPLLASFDKGRDDPSSSRSYWQPAIRFLHGHLTPSYRVEVVDTVGHWEALYLPEAGIPLARGWFRQDDSPQNAILYGVPRARAYLHWLRGLGIRYVVLTSAPADYSARHEAALLRGGISGLRPVLHTATTTIYAVPTPRAIVVGPGRPRIVDISQTSMRIHLTRAGRYRLAVRYSPYWRPRHGCVAGRPDGMTELTSPSAGLVRLSFDVTLGRALAALRGHPGPRCAANRVAAGRTS
jgi:hypothetical protein